MDLDQILLLHLILYLYSNFSWSFFEVHTNQSETDENQARAAGMLEGYLTSDLIFKHYQNMYASYCNNEQDFCERLMQFVHKNFEWMEDQVKKNPTDEYWYQVRYIFSIHFCP